MRILTAQLQNKEISPDKYIESLISIIGHSLYSRNYSYRMNLVDSISKSFIEN